MLFIFSYLEADQYFKTITGIYPFEHDGLLMYAWTNLQLGKMKEVKILFNKILLYNPNDESAIEGLSHIK